MVSGREFKLIGTTNFRIQSGENITVRGTVTVCSFSFDQGSLTTVRMIFLKVFEPEQRVLDSVYNSL